MHEIVKGWNIFVSIINFFLRILPPFRVISCFDFSKYTAFIIYLDIGPVWHSWCLLKKQLI
jgi:hypothetical protein